MVIKNNFLHLHHEKVTYNIATDNCHFCPLICYFWHLVYVPILHHVQFVILHTTNYRTIMEKEILNQAAKSVKKINDYLNQKPSSEWSFDDSILYATACDFRCRIIEYKMNHHE